MALYEYQCKDHKFELILPMSEQGKPQQCPIHKVECPAIDYSSTSPFVWGMEDTHWSAGLSSNPNGMSRAKKV